MFSRNALIFIVSTAMSAGVLMANQGAAVQNHARTHEGFVNRISAQLSLTAQQQQDAKAIFKSEREAARPVRQELFTERKAVRDAIHSGKSLADVQQLATSEGPALGKLAGMRAQAFAKFYAELTPVQQQKLASMHQQWRQNHANKGRQS
jgi:periplasmic protein CpxP/Spy